MLANAGVRRAGVAAAPRKSTSRSAAVRASSRDSQRAQAAPGRAVLFTSDSLTGRQSLFRILRLPTLLLTALAFGVAFPEPGVQLAAAGGVAATTKLVFLLVGIGLRASDAKASTSHPFAALYAVLSCLLLAPLAASALLRAASLFPTVAPELFAGVAVMLCVPTALSTGVVLTQQAGGNVPLSLLLVLVTLVCGAATVPLAVQAVFGGAGFALDAEALFSSLANSVLAPLATGVTLSLLPLVRTTYDTHCRSAAKALQQACLVATPWMAVSCVAGQLRSTPAQVLLCALCLAAGTHVALLAFNAAAASALGLGGRGASSTAIRIPVVLAASQKTLPVTVALLERLGSALGEPSLLLIPAILYHLSQLVIDALLVGVWHVNRG